MNSNIESRREKSRRKRRINGDDDRETEENLENIEDEYIVLFIVIKIEYISHIYILVEST